MANSHLRRRRDTTQLVGVNIIDNSTVLSKKAIFAFSHFHFRSTKSVFWCLKCVKSIFALGYARTLLGKLMSLAGPPPSWLETEIFPPCFPLHSAWCLDLRAPRYWRRIDATGNQHLT